MAIGTALLIIAFAYFYSKHHKFRLAIAVGWSILSGLGWLGFIGVSLFFGYTMLFDFDSLPPDWLSNMGMFFVGWAIYSVITGLIFWALYAVAAYCSPKEC